jgi:hypothetical protein
MNRYLAELGWKRTVESATKTGFGPLTVVVVAAGVRAAPQSAHVADSVLLEWWWATTATANHTVSSRHSDAVAFFTKHAPHQLRNDT